MAQTYANPGGDYTLLIFNLQDGEGLISGNAVDRDIA